MALINDPDNLYQGGSTSVTDAAWGAPAGMVVTITSAGAQLPAINAGDFFEVRSHSLTVNNGLYKETGGTPTTSAITATKVSGSAPLTSAAESVTTLGTAASVKNIFYDTAARHVYLLEKHGLGADGVTGQAVYSRMMMDWKDDNFLIADAPFPILCIDADAGKYFIGTDASGNYSGWCWEDNGTHSIRTRKLLRSIGWSEVDSNGVIQAIHSGIVSLGSFEDPTNDIAYYQFGTDTTVDDTVNFAFAGPVNEAVKAYDEIGNPPTCTFATSSTITRASGSFVSDGYKVGGRVTIREATVSGNDGTFTLTGVAALTLTVSGTPFTTGADAAAQLAVDNLNAISLRLRIRDADPTGKTFAEATLASGGETILSNRVFKFPLANASDLKITATDVTIDGSAPYTGMTITYYATPQSKGGGGLLVGGPYNFGVVVDGNNGTNQQVYEWTQRQLRKNTDIDAGGAIGIGRTLDGMHRFVGDLLECGSTDGGLTFPNNPLAGGDGVFIENLNAASKNFTLFFDNTGTKRYFPVSVPVTLDFNVTLETDSLAKFTLFFDRTIRTTVVDLVVTAGTGANGTITSAGVHLPVNAEIGVGKYIRVEGLTGVDAAMNGIYQITMITTPGANWSVTRYDGTTVVTTSSASASVDQHVIDSPDAIIVNDDLAAPVTGLIGGTDFSFSFDYSNNTQGGRTGGTDAYVLAKAIGQQTAQYTQSTVQTIQSGIALTIPLTSQVERNFSNP